MCNAAVRTQLKLWARQWNKPELSEFADSLVRRKRAKRAPKSSETISDNLVAQIRSYKKSNPRASQTEIGRRFNVNQGRVSEALHGKAHTGVVA